MRNRLKEINFYLTSIDTGSSIDNLVDTGSFVVKDTIVNWFSLTDWDQVWFVIVDADSTWDREIFRISNVNLATKTLTFDKRISPNWKKTHTANALVQINDFAELFNYIATHIDDIWYCEVVSWRDVKVSGGIAKFDSTNNNIADITVTLNPNDTNYIILNLSSWDVEVVTDLTWLQYYLFATWVTNWTDVLSLSDDRWLFVWFNTDLVTPVITVWNTTTLDPWADATVSNSWTTLEPILNFWIPRWQPWAIAEAPVWEAQVIVDNSPLPSWWYVEIIWSTIKITQSDWSYTIYSETDIITYDVLDNQISIDPQTWTFATPVMTYVSWMVVNWTTWLISYSWNPAYKDKANVFTWVNEFQWTTIFKWNISTPYHVIASASWNFTFDNALSDYQWVTITWVSDHICSFDNLVVWIKSLIVIQSWTWKLDFNIWTWCSTVVSVTTPYDLVWNKLYDNTVALASWTYFFTFAVAETAAHMAPPFKS